MKIAVIGGGFTGLSAAYRLAKSGHSVTIFEKEPHLGGLAYGLRQPNWQWFIEGAYHHLFTNDSAILSLARDIGLQNSIIVKRPITASLYKNKMYPLDSPASLLSFPAFSLTDKLRTAALIGILKITPFWRPLEHLTAESLVKHIGGDHAWKIIWEPLLYGKFGDLAPTVSAAWFWARIKKRTPSLCYIRGGFHTLVAALEKAITDHDGTIHANTSVSSIQYVVSSKKQKTKTETIEIFWNNQKSIFDKVLLTTPTPISHRLIRSNLNTNHQILHTYFSSLRTIPHLHAQVLILETRTPILDKIYWLNVTDRSFPFLAAVAHTNFMDPAHYGGHHLTYFGNYLPAGHPYLVMTKEQLLKKFLPFINRISLDTTYQILHTFLFTGPFAQPVHQLNYSQKIPPIATPLPGIYMANMDYVYPWDRGTNYAVELGQKAAKVMLR